MKEKNKNFFIGMAWPYANGSLHLGHLSAFIPADILARYHRLNGDNVLFVSGSDCHGTPISIKARKENTSPLKIAEKYHTEFKKNFDTLGFTFDYYGQTSSSTHANEVKEIFLKLYEKELIYKKTESLTYCEKCEEFLPDRYVEGTCPKCSYADARGDQCDECGELLDPQDLISPRCKTCGSEPTRRDSEHFFLKLTAFEKELKAWLKTQTTWRTNALNFTKGFLEQGLKDRAITRDIDWGIDVPLSGYETKKIYVWFEAVCGYFTNSVQWAKDNDKNIEDWWGKDSQSWHYYVHGKDNIPFHSIIWPSILMGSEKHLPNQIVSSEYLSLEKKQFSTSRDWAVWVPDYLEKYKADPLRYYLIANGPETHDSDFSWDKYVSRNNTEIVGCYGNLVNRFLGFTLKNFDGAIRTSEIDTEVSDKINSTFEKVSELILSAKFREALKTIFELAQFGNQYIDKKEPWKIIKEDRDACEKTLYNVLQIIYNLSILLYPFLPFSSEKIFSLLNVKPADVVWGYASIDIEIPLEAMDILFERLDPEIAEEEKASLGSK